MDVIAYDPYPLKGSDINYVSKEELFKNSDIISLHCPLTDDTKHIINKKSLQMMKDGVYILNTSRGRLIESESLYEAIKNGKVGAAGLDVCRECPFRTVVQFPLGTARRICGACDVGCTTHGRDDLSSGNAGK